MRLEKRGITRAELLQPNLPMSIVEMYPADKFLPSALVLVDGPQGPRHVLFALDEQERNVRVVTAYRPDQGEWEPDWKTRRRRS